MNTLSLQLALVISTAIIITARPSIPQYERIRKYRLIEEPKGTYREPQSPTNLKTTTSLLSTTKEGNNYHKFELLHRVHTTHLSYDDFVHLTSHKDDSMGENYHHHENIYSSTQPETNQSQNHDSHTTNRLHRTFLRIPAISATVSKVILESEESNEDYQLFESYIYS